MTFQGTLFQGDLMFNSKNACVSTRENSDNRIGQIKYIKELSRYGNIEKNLEQ